MIDLEESSEEDNGMASNSVRPMVYTIVTTVNKLILKR
jgi:hypothetical protein